MHKEEKKKSKKEYVEKLHTLAGQAEIEGKQYISSFIRELLQKPSVNVEIYDYIYKTTDDMTDALSDAYSMLLKNDATLEWYCFIGNISDEMKNPEQYFSIIIDGMKRGIEMDRIQEFLQESNTCDEFRDRINEFITNDSDKPFLNHLIQENDSKNRQIETLLEEMSAMRQEIKELREEAFSHRYNFMKSNQELAEVKRSSSKAILTEKLLTRKNDSLQAANMLLEQENEKLREERQALIDENEEIRSTRIVLEKQLEEKRLQVETLKQQLSIFEESIFSPEEIEMVDVDEVVAVNEIMQEELEEDDLEEYTIGTNIFENIVPIENQRDNVVKHTNLFATIMSKYYEKKFEKKTLSEQDNLIFIKMMEKNFTKEMVQIVKKAIATNATLSRTELYLFISSGVSKEALLEFCGIPA